MNQLNKLNYLLTHLASVIAKQSDQILNEQLGIGASQYRILSVLEWNPRVGQKTISTSLGLTEASISRQIKLLKNKGLLAVKVDPQNRRKHITLPTPRGMQITEAANDILNHHFKTEFNRIDTNQINQTVENLQTLHKIVCKTGKVGACDHQYQV
ncbi:MAG: hypothetical protein NVS1B10_03400 [Candidatus Saccharimonadales bacterium]